MKRWCVLACLALVAGCHDGKSPAPHETPPKGQIFDPCVADPQPGYDPASQALPACCTDTGPAHCVPNAQVLPTLQAALMKCDDSSVCMPDPIIKAGGQYAPPACTSSVGNTPGVCLSQCITLVSSNKEAALLGQDGCGDGELCVPCNNPIDGKSTGACQIVAALCGGADMATGPGSGGMCPYTGPPLIDPTKLPDCAPACGGSHCLPVDLVPAGQQSLLNACTAADGKPGLCAPDPLIAAGGNFVPKTCKSVAGFEGRCLSTCLPSVAGEADLLPQDVCQKGELCAPCFNPLDLDANGQPKPTGACTIACDKPVAPPQALTCPWTGPPVIDTKKLGGCSPQCGGAHCVSTSLVPASVQPLLASCNGGKGLCAPDKIVAAAGQYVPPSCTSIAGAEGRCLSRCLPSVAAQAGLLPQDTCAAGDLCVPCFNPTAGNPNDPTGACTLACDKPAKPPVVLSCPYSGPPVIDPTTFPDCSPTCGGAHCVPKALVPQNEQSLLASCDNGNGVCAPDPVISSDNHFVPKSCTSVAGAEGRCLSTCLPDVASQAALLPVDVCAANERCTPCFNPTAADPTKPTGACGLGCDMPQQPPVVLACPYNGPPVVDPNRFENCSSTTCNGAHCLPAALVPPGQAGLLAPCAGGGFCTPDPIITSDNHFVPQTCTSVAGAEGRCLSTCLPMVQAQASLLPQADCPAFTKCVPCYDPTSATPDQPTGACALACDKATKPPVHISCPWSGPAVLDPASLPACDPSCSGAHCLPANLVPAAQQSLLATCNNGAGFCTPDPIISTENNYVAPTCTSIAGAEGRCMSTCLPMVAQQGNLLPRGTCGSTERCVPCFNPLDLDASGKPKATGACGLACDKPAQGAVQLTCPWNGKPAVIDPAVLPACGCNGAHCLPSQYVPSGVQSQLATCGGGFCTPDPMIQDAGDYLPPTCVAFAGTPAEGRCLSTCIPSVAGQSSLEVSTCNGSLERCAPCYDPLSGADTGACHTASCDKPGSTKYTFPNCCFYNGGSQGRCIPNSQVPSNPHLKQDECAGGFMCVPTDQLPGHSAPSCSTALYSGTCYSQCLDLTWVSIFLLQGNCPDNFKCVP